MVFEQSEASKAIDREALLSLLPEISEKEIRQGEMQIPVTEGLPDIELFTDGGCSPNPGPGAWAFILRPVNGPAKSSLEHAGAVRRSTNNRMELTAVIRGLLSLDRPCRVRVVSDSEYVIKGLSEWIEGWKRRGWVNSRKKPVLNEELWRVLDTLRHHHNLDPQWTRGHAGHAENERCDVLVGQVRDQLG